MFEIGFSEILLILVIALVVVGPQKLPRIASQVGKWVGRARNMARQFREQLESEVDLDRATKWAEDKKPAASASTAAAGAAAAGAAAADATAAADTPPPPPEPAPVYPYTDHQPYSDQPAATDDTYSHAHALGGSMEAADTTQVDWVSVQNGAPPAEGVSVESVSHEPPPTPATSAQPIGDTHERLHDDHHSQS